MYVRNWLKAWFEKVQQTLFGPEGITKLVVTLKAISDKHSAGTKQS
jgi:hypothetical protein